MSAIAEPVSASRPASAGPWIYRPWLDLLVGCGGWSAPLLAVAAWLRPSHTQAWLVAFYALAVVFNYPHFMATIYRAYHTREDFEKYRIFTLHLTLLLFAAGALLHAWYGLVPWVFTLYICWSPWHYTGQNYGLLMMFARRSGADVSPAERRWIRAAFIASYVMLLASFETGASGDALILSLGLPARITMPARLALGAAFALFSALAFRRLIRRCGARALAAPLTLALTQLLWFVLPTLLELRAQYQVPQTRYSSGILAVLHSAQYLWITSYYQQREARAAGKSRWRMAMYFVTLVAGGIALFIPGPWLVSTLLRFDFTTSFLIFTAIVNIHHFLLDGALWKLRDSRIASLLIGRGKSPQTAALGGAKPDSSLRGAPGRFARRILSAPAFRVSLAALLFLWGGIDQVHFALGTDEQDVRSLQRAVRMNPYDSMMQARLASAESKAGWKGAAIDALVRAVAANPQNAALQHECARAMLEDGRYVEAYERYRRMLEIFPHNADALVNYGLLAARLGHPDEALASWQAAVDADAHQPNAHLYLAQAFDHRREPAVALRHWEAFLAYAASHPQDPAIAPGEAISARIQLADDQTQLRDLGAALAQYQTAVALAEGAGAARLESLTLAHLADAQEKNGQAQAAAGSYQRALALDAKSSDRHSEALDWFNYGQFLRRRSLPDDLAYACLLRAEQLLAGAGGLELEAAQRVRRGLENRLGKKAAAVRNALPSFLARAAGLPPDSF